MFSAVSCCRLCQGENLRLAFDLGLHALSCRFPTAGEPSVPVAPLQLLFCERCGLAQLAHNYDSDELFLNMYGYRSGLNATMRNHLSDLVLDASGRIKLRAGDTVLDIGSNDGTLLGSYTTRGIKRIGIDPTSKQFAEFYPVDVTRREELFSAELYEKAADGPARIITSIAMFYDLPDPNTFVADIARSLAPEGIWVLEQSYVLSMLEQNSFDTICHEHLEYYGLRQIQDLARRNGLRVFDVAFNDINGGSFRAYVCHDRANYSVSQIVASTTEREMSAGLDTIVPFEAFRCRSDGVAKALSDFVDQASAAGKSIFLYGASTKGNTLLQYCGIDKRQITAAAERNPAKYGCRTPGTDIPIISEAEARTQNPDYFLVLPWHFRPEFIEREREFLANGGNMIFPLPELEIV